ncbi:uncharacterized protein B0H18DRAFT_1121199 [Fomitopsis serialis]|uniref:uncharacterized protein n=1 Tax=Fomitopsis serialis TaxID=139415 RepID=UPI00200873F2|nr:uncharacterized protein B0H18DRAFT_1121199 [Neoantrodia serialis]KAH9921904.1 hypothetical protein B0H18DRAFT_1121199 [Neoantrodia serialis]
MFALGAIVALFAASVSAIPALNTRQTGASCAGFGSGSTDTPTYNFTLTAYNTTLPNTNSSGAPLVLGWGPPGTSPEASYWAISTYAEWHSNDWPYFSLEGGAIYPNPGPDEQGLGAYDYDIASGAEVGFLVLPTEPGRDVPKIYCAALRNGDVLLAVNNDADSFSLCQSVPNTSNVLVYQANSNNSDYYDYSTCYGVDVFVIPYDG